MSKNIATKLVEAIDRAITPAPPAKPKSDIEIITAALVAMALPDLKRAIPDVMKQAVASEAAKGQCQRLIHDSGEDAAMSAFLKQQTDLAEQAQGGTLDDREVWDLADFREDNKNRQRAALDAWTKIDKAQAPIREQVVSQFLEIVNSYISEVETNDKASYERFGLNYSGSSLPALLRSTTSFIENRGFPLIVAAINK